MSATPYKQLELEWQRLNAFRGALSLLRWDAAVMMPRGSADVRGEQLAAIETEHHSVLTTPRVTRLLERAQANSAGLNDWQLANLREMRRQRDRAIATPASLIQRLARATAVADVRWEEARQRGDFQVFAPHLEEVLHLVRDKAALLGQALHLEPYDALLDEFSPGLRSADIDALARALTRRLPALIREVIAEQDAHSHELPPLTGSFPPSRQKRLITEVMKALGFSFERGRLDESTHPFTEGVAGDIRVTTRIDGADPFSGLLAALHETGHALYDLGVPPEWNGQPVGIERGMALEESQSLLIEMILCRSRPFLQYLRPLLEKHFGVSGPEWEVEALYRRLTRVRRSLVRVDADELTYPLHIMLRHDLEQQLLGGQLAVRDLPEAWREGMRDRLEIVPGNDVEGCLQDVHWAHGSFGYFPSYAVGAAIAAQLSECLRTTIVDIDDQIARGDFGGFIGWLREHVHGHGARVGIQELVKQATGKPLSAAPSLRYLEHKYLKGAAA
jgi:carboxypeptidase Taq